MEDELLLREVEEDIEEILSDDPQLELQVNRGHWERLLPIIIAKVLKHYDEKLFNRTMEAKKSGWDDCEKWHRGHRLDRPELREKTFDLVTDTPCRNCDYWDVKAHHCFQNIRTNSDNRCNLVDQILALFPNEEEIRKDWMERLEKQAYHQNLTVGIGKFAHTEHCLVFPDREWQALKENQT